MRILLAEDDSLIAQALKEALLVEGFSVDHAADGETALVAMQNNEHAHVLLDIGLPKLNDVKVLQQARQQGIKTPAIMITARDGLSDRILGLDAGADDYLVKPFEVAELLARNRRCHWCGSGDALSPGAERCSLVLDCVYLHSPVWGHFRRFPDQTV